MGIRQELSRNERCAQSVARSAVRKAEHIQRATEIAEERAMRSDDSQLKLLDGRPGDSRKERARLLARIAERKNQEAKVKDIAAAKKESNAKKAQAKDAKAEPASEPVLTQADQEVALASGKSKKKDGKKSRKNRDDD